MKRLICLLSVLTIAVSVKATVADFEDLTLGPDSHWSGNYTIDTVGGNLDTSYINSGSAAFENHSDGDWAVWAGFAYSNMIDTDTEGVGNQFSAYAGQAQSGSNFGIGYQDSFNGFLPTAIFDTPIQVPGLYVTNTTYAALDMVTGSTFSKQFGGISGNEEDWFMLTITGKDLGGTPVGTVDFYLADFRFTDNAQDYILDKWEYVDLTSLGIVTSLEFSLTSSDNGDFGMNTPAYFAVDTVIPEPTSVFLLGLGALVLRKK